MQIGFMNFYGAILDVRDARAGLIADNIANADTPGFKAQDVPFDTAMAAELGADATPGAGAAQYRADATVGLNGNDVDLDSERVEAAANGEAMQGAAVFLRQSTSDLVTALRPNPSGV